MKTTLSSVIDKAEVHQTIDFSFAEAGLEAAVKLLQAFGQREAGPPFVLPDAFAIALL